jgi:hypothetical protein
MEKSKVKTMPVYSVREFQRTGSEETEESWTLIGTCFPNRKDEGFTVRLNAIPLDGKLVVRPPREDDASRAEHGS